MLKLTGHVGITIFSLYKQKKKRWNSDIQNFYSEILNFLNFRLFSAENRNFDWLYSFWYGWIEEAHAYLLIPKSIS